MRTIRHRDVSARVAAVTVVALLATILALAAPRLASAQAAPVTGQIFIDFDRDGALDPGEIVSASDPLYPPGGVQVVAFDSNGASDACTVTGTTYNCTFNGLTGTDFRLQFALTGNDAGAGWSGTIRGADSKSSVQFVSESETADWGITPPSKCPNEGEGLDGNANVEAGKLWGTCFVNGSATSAEGPNDTIVAVNADNSGIIEHAAVKNQTGSVWGLAYNEWDSVLFASSFVKRHVGLGPEGADGLYWSTYPSTTWSSVSLESLGGPSFGGVQNRDLGDPTDASYDADAFGKVGKVGIGDVDVTPDGRTLLVSNLAANAIQLYDVSGVAGGGDPVFEQSITIPNPGCSNVDYQVYGIKAIDAASAYVGVTCTAETSQDPADLNVQVLKLDLNSGGTTGELTVPMSYSRPCAGAITSGVPMPVTASTCNAITPNGQTIVDSTFLPWSDDIDDYGVKNNSTIDIIRPQPILSDIEIREDGGLVIGIMDRSSHQIGNRNYLPDPTGADPTVVKTVLSGEILRVCNTSSNPAAPAFIVEGTAASCPVNFIDPTGGDSSDGEFRSGPFSNGEFYDDEFGTADRGTPHGENHSGGLYVRPYRDQIVHSALDPLTFGAGGLDWLSDVDGSQQLGRDFYSENPVGSFAKAGGVGDVEGCFVPLEIGDFVWFDADRDGIQDPDETPLEGVRVILRDAAGNQLAQTFTDADGNYIFDSSVLDAGTSYIIEFDVSSNVTPLPQGASNADLIETIPNAGDDLADSDVVNFQISIDTEAPGINNHSYDAGFVLPRPQATTASPSLDIDKSVDNPSTASDKAVFTITVTNDGDVALTDVTVTDPLFPVCDRVIGNLDVGETFTYTCEAFIGKATTNVASVIGSPPDWYDGPDPTASDSARVQIGLGTSNLLPVASDDKFDGVIGQPLSFDICANDVESEPWQTKTRLSGHYAPGLSRTGCVISGVATACGTYNYSYRVTDPQGDTDTADVVITITGCENIVPDAQDDDFAGQLGATAAFDICSNDTDGDGWQTKTRISGGFPPGMTRAGCLISGVPTRCGVFTYTYLVTDGSGDTDSAVVTITIEC